MFRKKSLYYLVIFVILLFSFTTTSAYHHEKEGFWASGPLVKKEERRTLVSTEYGQISAARVTDNINGSFLLHFFTLEPNALFLPVILHADMVFYVQTGSGRLSWTEEGNLKLTDIRRGDVYRLQHGSVFFIQSNLETDQTTAREKLRIHAIFVNSFDNQHEPEMGPYSSIRDMVIGFDRNVLQATFKVPKDVIDDLLNGSKQPAIIHGVTKAKKSSWDREAQFISGILGSKSFNLFELNKKKKKKKDDANLFNIFKEDKDFENCNGWSTTVTKKKLSDLRDSNIGLFMVNLTTGSMMGPHWNPKATEIAIVLQGQGMVRVVCSSISNETSRFHVEEGDIFVVPRFNPMAQMAFNNETFVFMGFSTSAKMNHPQYLAGQASVLRTLDRDIMAMSFGVENTTFDQLLAPQHNSVILGCMSCAEEELRIMREEIAREREKAREREEEEARKREEEKKREEEARKREEEAARRRDEERKREEEEKARREEEERKREEEKAIKEEEEREKQEQEEERRRREKEEAARREDERVRREQEEEAARKEEEERERREQEVSVKREEEERQRREQEEATTRRERQKQEEAERREEGVRQKREQEEKVARREEKERERQEQEEAASRREERGGGRSEEEQAAEEERRMEEEARREEEEQEHGGEGENQFEHEQYDRKWIRIFKMRLTV